MPPPVSGKRLVVKKLNFLAASVQLHIPPETAWKAQTGLLAERSQSEKWDIPEEVRDAVIPLVWASKMPGRAKNVTPVKTELKPGAQPERKAAVSH